jgi:hypothetical protein
MHVWFKTHILCCLNQAAGAKPLDWRLHIDPSNQSVDLSTTPQRGILGAENRGNRGLGVACIPWDPGMQVDVIIRHPYLQYRPHGNEPAGLGQPLSTACIQPVIGGKAQVRDINWKEQWIT